MKKTICLTTAFVLLGSAASQALAEVEGSGGFTLGVQQIELQSGSSSAKFNEYRDIRDGFQLYELWLDLLDDRSEFIMFNGRNLLRDDQSMSFRFGEYGRWNFELNRNEIPHRISDRARTPYIYQGNGLFTVPGQVPIVQDGNDATGTQSLVPTVDQMAVNDDLIRDWLPGNLRPVELGTQRKRTGALLNFSFLEQINFRLKYSDERKEGSRVTYGTLGDRPPRTLNVQLPEPIDYTTRELGFDAEYAGAGFQTHLSYLFSTFDNNVQTMRWENIYFAPAAPGDDFIAAVAGTPRNVSTFGQRSLAPDNYAHNVSLSGGIDLPMNSRLAGTAAYGLMKQDETLLPYSFSSLGGDTGAAGDGLDWNDPAKLPRQSADAELETMRLDLDYTINPIDRLNLRAFFRYYDLDNKTPTDEWRYATQDTAGTDGSVNYRNYRRNLAFAYEKINFGLDASQYFSFWRTTFAVGYEREEIDRDFREADTDENIFKASVRTRPTDWLSLRANYLFGDRSSDSYDYNVTSQSYWYNDDPVAAVQGANDVDNPANLFANHPDLRKYDVSDRERNQFDLAATIAAMPGLDVGGAYSYRQDDFDSGVGSVQPLLGTTVALPNPADELAETPGLQLGLLEEKRQNFSLDAHYAPATRWSVSLFANRQEIDTTFRGMVFNENQRREPSNPGIQSPTALGPWTDPDRIFNAKLEDRTNTFGVGAGYEIIPGRLRLSTDYTFSRGKVDLDYTGYGSDPEFLGRDWETFQFGFNDPKTVRHNQYVLNASLEYQVYEGLIFGLHYLFDRYSMEDWMLEADGPWVEQHGSEFFLRDTSRDNRWGNRLVNMGEYFGASYEAHVTSVTMTYRF